MTPLLEHALYQVTRERHRQEDRWGTQRHGMTVWGAVLAEEVGEAAQATLNLRSAPLNTPDDRRKHIAALRREVIQIAAVAVAWLEHLNEAEAAGDVLAGDVWEG